MFIKSIQKKVKMQKVLLLFVLGICFLFSCSDDELIMDGNENSSINKIMPLGASRVAGSRPNHESFRYELWKLLVDSGKQFDYIGTQDDPSSYPDYNGLTFDDDHEGRGGWRSDQILGGIDSWIDQAGVPDIVLFSSPGGNDALQGRDYDDIISNINNIIDAIQTSNPNVTIIIEQLAPPLSSSLVGQLGIYFERMIEDAARIADEQTTSTSMVLSVDMASGFTDALLADQVHYNEEGAKFIADRYFEVLEGVME